MTTIELAKTMIRTGRDLGVELYGTAKYLQHSPTRSMADMDYDEYWRVRGYHHLQPRFKLFADIIEPGSTVLDVGCGDGLTLSYLAKHRKIRGVGIDLSLEAVRLARSRGVTAFVADIFHWHLTEKFDYIIISEVLEHLADAEGVLLKLRSFYKKKILISIPNIGYYRHRLRLLLGNFPIQWGWHPAEHLRFWTVSDFTKWIATLNLEVTEIKSSNGFPILHYYQPNLFSNQVVFVVR
ncbi:methionine biosynthesis protein MetW [Anaerolineales bacterium HSG6]|nr:methionine biosynthesis protein MetW [Anaerolineales bacterium HSG6]MDM8531055.1 methionine biosynthesis protein MetW [Anaerolineales bacterium HSG25]